MDRDYLNQLTKDQLIDLFMDKSLQTMLDEDNKHSCNTIQVIKMLN